MAKAKEINNNSISNNSHVCNEKKEKLDNHKESIIQSTLTTDEINAVFDFYVLHAPILRSGSDKTADFGMKSFGEYGWYGNRGLSELERNLLKSGDVHRFVMIRADSIDETLENMGLKDDICIKHPRAVMQQNFKVTVKENGEVKLEERETRMQCLFRHIRNSIAHNRTYLFENGEMILLEDADTDKKVTARILIKVKTLVDWIQIIRGKTQEHPQENYADNPIEKGA